MNLSIGSGFNRTEQVWYNSDWATRRMQEQEWHDWYSGLNITEPTSSLVDPDTGQKLPLYPLGLNPIGKVCRVHQMMMVGLMPTAETLPVKIVFDSPDDNKALKDDALALQEVVSQIMEDSDFSTSFLESALMSQVRGGFAYKIAWDHVNSALQYRTRWVALPGSAVWPVYDATDYWNLRECYIGYMISAQEAKLRYGIDLGFVDNIIGRRYVLYLEHWTPDSYEITVHGQTPNLTGYGELKGPNPIGRVPVVYVPHMRDGEFYGRSHIPELVGLTKELNLRAADVGDAIRDITHPERVGKNLRNVAPQIRDLADSRGNRVGEYIDIGNGPIGPGAGASEPSLDYMQPPALPDTVTNFDAALWDLICKQSDTAPVLLGEDEVSSGRVTGPVTAYRTLPTMFHSYGERMQCAAGLKHMTDITLRLLQAKSKELSSLGVKLPKIADEHLAMHTSTTWLPQIPIEVSEKNTMLNESLREGGISLQSYLADKGIQDTAAERERILQDKRDEAEIETVKIKAQAEVKAQQFADQQKQREQAAPKPRESNAPTTRPNAG